MDRDSFLKALELNHNRIAEIRDLAHKVHAAVNQHYNQVYPYSIHLDSVVEQVIRYGHEVCQSEDDVVPMIFGAYFHDSIEDARLTYNNVLHLASKSMDEKQARMATEIAYALTNEKGRNRAERANDKYYYGIRNTPYAPLCKMADRLANVSYSAQHSSESARSASMRHVYAQEHPHFVASVVGGTTATDPRMRVPKGMIEALEELLHQ